MSVLNESPEVKAAREALADLDASRCDVVSPRHLRAVLAALDEAGVEAGRLRANLDALTRHINDVIDRKRLPEEASEIALTMERHYGLVVQAAGQNGDLAEDLAQVSGVNLDNDNEIDALKRAAERVRHLARRNRGGHTDVFLGRKK